MGILIFLTLNIWEYIYYFNTFLKVYKYHISKKADGSNIKNALSAQLLSFIDLWILKMREKKDLIFLTLNIWEYIYYFNTFLIVYKYINTYRYLTPNGDAIIDKYQKSSYVKTLKMKLRFAENNFSY